LNETIAHEMVRVPFVTEEASWPALSFLAARSSFLDEDLGGNGTFHASARSAERAVEVKQALVPAFP